MNAWTGMLTVLRAELGVEETDECPTAAQWDALWALAKHHDLAHLVGDLALQRGWLSGEARQAAQKAVWLAAYRYEQSEHEIAALRQTLEQADVPFVLLKGAVVRQYYPRPWMRNSCDVDVLVRKQDTEKAEAELIERLSYRSEGAGSHDVSLHAPSGVSVELHYALAEPSESPDAGLAECWEYAYPIKEGGKEHRFSEAYFLYYHVAHMAYHFRSGGCGVRPVLDWYFLKRAMAAEESVMQKLLALSGLSAFAEQVDALAEVWLAGRPHTRLTAQMERFIVSGGVYGTVQNVALVERVGNGKAQNLKRRLWMPYTTLQQLYPIVKKHRWLQPACEGLRWLRVIRNGRFSAGMGEIKANLHTSQKQAEEVERLLDGLGLAGGSARTRR